MNRETFTPQISNREIFTPQISNGEISALQISNREIFTPQISNGEISALQISNRETFTSQINQLPGPNIINSSNQLLTSEAEILSHSDDSCNEFDNSLKGLELLTQPLVIACYLGPSKPENVHEYFEDFVTETIALRDNGFEFDGKLIKLIPDAFLGDAPARAFVGCFNSHNAFNGCHRCTITGISINRRTCFLQTTRLGLRSNQTIDESFYRDTSPLLKINLNLTNDIPFDPMHQVYLGVVKRYIKLLFQNKFLLNDDDILNNCLQTACNNTPCEFSRKCYSLGDYKQWKATQFRQFVLYTGVFVLKNNKIPTVVYQNFLNLHVALRLLSTDTFVQNNNLMLFVKKLLIHFVDSFKVIFGDDNCVYNVHSLLHLVDDCQRFGFSMEFFSCFRYENFLGVLKRKIKECGKQLHQLSNRICEANSLEPSNNSFSIKFNSFTVKINGKDNFF